MVGLGQDIDHLTVLIITSIFNKLSLSIVSIAERVQKMNLLGVSLILVSFTVLPGKSQVSRKHQKEVID